MASLRVVKILVVAVCGKLRLLFAGLSRYCLEILHIKGGKGLGSILCTD